MIDEKLLRKCAQEFDAELDQFETQYREALRAKLDNPDVVFNARGQPCKRGEAASRTGCIPKSATNDEAE